jgi:hypothetical protein
VRLKGSNVVLSHRSGASRAHSCVVVEHNVACASALERAPNGHNSALLSRAPLITPVSSDHAAAIGRTVNKLLHRRSARSGSMG